MASPSTAPRQWPTCIGPVGLAETYSTLTLRRRRCRSARRPCRRAGSSPSCAAQKTSERRRLTKPGPATCDGGDVRVRLQPRGDRMASSRGFTPSGLASTIAALVATSPCVGSRGGSALMRSSAAEAASSWAGSRIASTTALIRCSKSVKRFIGPSSYAANSAKTAAFRGRGALTQIGGGVKQPPVLGDRVAVGHAGNVIGHAARRAETRRPGRSRSPIRRASARIGSSKNASKRSAIERLGLASPGA